MQKLHLVGVTTDHQGLILSARRGTRSGGYTLSVDDALAEVVEDVLKRQSESDDGDAAADPPTGERTPRVESLLSVREIQARLRRGRSVAEVAKAAGVEPSWVERFADPVFAERARVVERVRGAALRRARLGPSAVPIGGAVARNLADRGVTMSPDEADAAWLAQQMADGRWAVRFSYRHRGRQHVLRFDFDERSGEVTAANRASAQVGFVAPAPGAAQRRAGDRSPVRSRPTAKRATVSTGFRADGPTNKRASGPAKERERAAVAMAKATAKRVAEAERAAARRAREKQVEAAREERERAARERAEAAAERERERAAANAAKERAAQAASDARARAATKAEKQRATKAAKAKAAKTNAAKTKASKASTAKAAKASKTKASTAKAAKTAKASGPTKAGKPSRASTATKASKASKQSAPAKGRKTSKSSRATAGRSTKLTKARGATATVAKTTRTSTVARPAPQTTPRRSSSSDGPAQASISRRSPAPPRVVTSPRAQSTPVPSDRPTPQPFSGAASDVYGPAAARALFRAGLVEQVTGSVDGNASEAQEPSVNGLISQSWPPADRPRRTRPLRAT